MRNLWAFIKKYSAFFMFLIFEIFSLIILVNYNSFQKSTFISSSNEVTGGIFGKVNQFTSYLSLGSVNDSLLEENAKLRNMMKTSFYIDTLAKRKVTDTVFKQQYTYIAAKVINNSINRRNNYITINKGSKDGIAKDMGVICSKGVVGLVINVTQHLANVQSVLNKNTVVSGMLATTHDICSVKWTDDFDPHKGLVFDLTNFSGLKGGELIVTSGFSSLYPPGIPIGKINTINAKNSSLELSFAVDYGKLDYVYVISNKLAAEQNQIEALRKKDE